MPLNSSKVDEENLNNLANDSDDSDLNNSSKSLPNFDLILSEYENKIPRPSQSPNILNGINIPLQTIKKVDLNAEKQLEQ